MSIGYVVPYDILAIRLLGDGHEGHFSRPRGLFGGSPWAVEMQAASFSSARLSAATSAPRIMAVRPEPALAASQRMRASSTVKAGVTGSGAGSEGSRWHARRLRWKVGPGAAPRAGPASTGEQSGCLNYSESLGSVRCPTSLAARQRRLPPAFPSGRSDGGGRRACPRRPGPRRGARGRGGARLGPRSPAPRPVPRSCAAVPG